MHYVEVPCPDCDSPITVQVDRDGSYGSDYDGNRGGTAYSAEITEKGCKCELSVRQENAVEEAAVNEI